MTTEFYELKEHSGGEFRAMVVYPEEGRVDFVTGDDKPVLIALEDLAFLVRAARSLPRHLLDPTALPVVAQADALAADEAAERPERAGKRWSEEEVEQAVSLFASGSDITEIAKVHKRSPAAIVSHLLKLKRITVTVIR